MKNYVKNKSIISFLEPSIKKYKEGSKLALEKYKKCNVEADNEYGALFLRFLWVRDQAHIFHWQTKSNNQHVALGEFYEAYLEELDELVETLLGSTDNMFELGTGKMELMDYSEENLKNYLDKVTMIFEEKFQQFFPNNDKNLGIYHVLGDVLELVGKLKYLLSQN